MLNESVQSLYRRAAIRLGRRANYDKLSNLEELVDELPFVVIDHDFEGINGWLSLNERKALYALARWLPGPFLEIGPWVGLSTSIISYAIRESGQKKRFVTAELNPKIQNYRRYNGGIGFFVPPESSVPYGVCPIDLFERLIKPVVETPGGVIGTLKKNLDSKGLSPFVEIVEGDFTNVPNQGYKFVFSDTMHDPAEISRNAVSLPPYLGAGSYLACHDIDAGNEAELRKWISFSESVQIDSLFIGKISS